MAARGNEVEIVVTSKDKTKPGYASAKKGASGFGTSMSGIGKAAGGFLAANFVAGIGSKVADFFTSSTRAASSLGESLSKSNTIFGRQASEIERWAGAADRNVGLAKGAALDAAAGFGNMFTQLGIGQQRAATMSTSMVGLASDFASFHNVDISEVIEAQSAAFRGEYDSVQRFVPTINAARVEQEALRMTGKATTKELTDQDKALAVNMLLFKGAGKAVGDFARTSGSAANQERIANAEMANTNAIIGQKLLPVSMALTQVKLRLATVLGEKVVPALTALGGWISRNKELLLAIGVGIAVVLVPSFIAWAVAAGAAAAATIAATFPLILIGAAVAALAFLIIKNWDKIKAFTARVWPAIQGAISAVWNWVKANWPKLLAILIGPIAIAAAFIIRNWDKIKAGVQARVQAVIGFMRALPGRIRSAIGDLGRLLLDAGRRVVEGLINGIRERIGALASAAANLAGTIRNFLPFSPAKEGPLAGAGDPFKSGQKIASLVAGGITAGRGQVAGAMGGTLGGGGAAATLRISSGGSALDRLLVEVLRKAVRAQGGDVQVVLGAG